MAPHCGVVRGDLANDARTREPGHAQVEHGE